MDKVEIGKGLWLWYNGLPGIAKTIMSLFVMVTAPAIFIIAIWVKYPRVITNAEFEKAIVTRLGDMQIQITAGNLLTQRSLIGIDRQMDSIAQGQKRLETVIKNLSIVIIANSNDELFRRIAPRLDKIEDNTYQTIIFFQKEEILKRFDSAKIEIHKVNGK